MATEQPCAACDGSGLQTVGDRVVPCEACSSYGFDLTELRTRAAAEQREIDKRIYGEPDETEDAK